VIMISLLCTVNRVNKINDLLFHVWLHAHPRCVVSREKRRLARERNMPTVFFGTFSPIFPPYRYAVTASISCSYYICTTKPLGYHCGLWPCAWASPTDGNEISATNILVAWIMRIRPNVVV